MGNDIGTFVILVILFFFGWIYVMDDDGKLNINNPVVKYHFKEFWSRSFDFTGKTKRKEFWIATLVNLLIILSTNYI